MFSIKVGSPLRVHSASCYEVDGRKGALVTLMECENQPMDSENPSKSKYLAKIWLDNLPEGVVAGGLVVFDTILGVDVKHVRSTDINGNKLTDKYGNPAYHDELVLIVDGLQKFPPEENAKKQKSKANA